MSQPEPRRRRSSRKRRVAVPKPQTDLQLIRAADVEPEELEFLWPLQGEGRIPKGVITLIGGRPGQGKSLVTNYLAAEVTKAGGAVIMSNPEDPVAAVKVPRLLAAGADTRLVHFWPGKLRLPADVEELEQFVLFHGVELVTIDPIAKHVQGKDPNTALEPLAAMAERTKCAVVGVHHLNKRLPKDAHPQEAFGGASGGWLGTVRFAHVLGPTGAGEAEARFLAVAKSNHGNDDIPSVEFYMDEVDVDLPGGGVTETVKLVFVADDRPVHASDVVHYRAIGFRKENPEKRAVAMEFITLLLVKGPVPANEVFDKAAEHGVSKMTCKRASQELGVQKDRVGAGPGSYIVWSLPDDHPLMQSLGQRVSAGEELDEDDVDAAIRQILAEADEEDDDDDGDE
jgi:hypothetical protein